MQLSATHTTNTQLFSQFLPFFNIPELLFADLRLFSYASSSTLYPCQWVGGWVGHSFGLQPSSVAWSLRACFNWGPFQHCFMKSAQTCQLDQTNEKLRAKGMLIKNQHFALWWWGWVFCPPSPHPYFVHWNCLVLVILNFFCWVAIITWEKAAICW